MFFQNTKDRFYRALALTFHITAKPAVYSLVVAFIFFTVGGNVDPLLMALANTSRFDGTALTITAFGKIVILKRTFLQLLFPEGYFLALWAQPVVPFFYILEAFRATFIRTMGRNVTFDPFTFQVMVVLPAAITSIGQIYTPSRFCWRNL